jgi:hypothetical protein
MTANPTQPVILPDLSRLPPSVAKSVVDHVQALIEQFAQDPVAMPGVTPAMPPEDWILAHRAWLKSLPRRPDSTMDDSRESIYGGRGE